MSKKQQIGKIIALLAFVSLLALGSYYLYYKMVKPSPYLQKKPMHEQADTTRK
jgi:hypothetical protein